MKQFFSPWVSLVFLLALSCGALQDAVTGDLEEQIDQTRMLVFLGLLSDEGSLVVAVDDASVEATPDPLQNIWAGLSNMPRLIQHASAETVGGKEYVIGGINPGSGGTSDRVDEYDPVSGAWTQRTKMPSPRYNAAAETYNGKIYVFGGQIRTWQCKARDIFGNCVSSGYRNYTQDSTLVYDPATHSWTTETPMPAGRFGAVAVQVNGRIYVMGGSASNNNEEYDPATKTWTTRTNVPFVASFSTAAAVNGKIYVIGGSTSPYNHVYEYDPATDTWSTAKTPMPTGRYYTTAQVVNGKIVVAGGYTNAAKNQVEEYDPATNTWESKTALPTARYGSISTVLSGNEFLVIGGNVSVIEKYDLVTTWTPVQATMQSARAYHAAAYYNNNIYVSGGFNSSYLNTMEILDLSKNVWRSASAMPVPRRYHASVELNGKIYLIGGHNSGSGILDSVDVYDPATDSYVAGTPLLTPRQNHAACVQNGKIYVFGGNTGGTYATAQNSVEEYDPLTDQWTNRKAMGEYKDGPTCASVGDAIYVFGGRNRSNIVLDRLESFDFSSDIWSLNQNMATARQNHATVVLQNRIYAVGGYSTTQLSLVEKYDPTLEQWIPENPMIEKRNGLTAISANNRIYAIGGHNGSAYLNNVEVFY